MSKKKALEGILTLESIYEDLSLLVFSILCMIIFGFLVSGQPLNPPSLRVYVGIGFFSMSFILFVSLIGKLFAYYGIKTYSWFRDRWDRYRWYYWIILLLLALAALIIFGYFKLSQEVFWSIIISVFAASILGSIGWIVANKIWGNKSKVKK